MRTLGLILCAGMFAVPSAAKLKVGIDVDIANDDIKSSAAWTKGAQLLDSRQSGAWPETGFADIIVTHVREADFRVLGPVPPTMELTAQVFAAAFRRAKVLGALG